MKLQKSDFIEIEFTAKTKDGNVFDSNVKDEIKKINPNAPEPKPFVYSLGHNMFLNAIDDFLIGKEIGKCNVELKPEQAFGKRIPQAVQRMPIKIFHEHKLNPVPGVPFNFDGKIGKVLAVSGGRVIVDFNHPLAGKEVVYEINVLKKVEGINEKVKALNEFLFKKEFKFEIREKKLILEVPKEMTKFIELFKDKFKEILGLELEIREIGGKKNEKTKRI